jgi:very-short-patch-repair endonuclease
MDPLRRSAIWQKLARARQLRREATGPERYAWSLLRKRQLLGLRFRRQHVLHGFVVDFYCAARKLVLELDGRHHGAAMQAEYDAARSATLQAAGYHVVRISNRDVSRARLEQLIGEAV